MPAISPLSEPLARFVTQRSHVRADHSLKAALFMPPRSGRLSVYQIVGLPEAEIWSIGRTHVADVLGKPLLGRADLSTQLVHDTELRVECVPTPHPRHADIVGWDPTETKVRLQALKLAGEAIFKPLPA